MKKRLKHDEFKGFPKEFRGCMWNDGWEFDAPSVIYYPRKFARYGDGGNSGVLDRLLEDIVCDLEDGKTPGDGGLARECEWRGWGKRFDRRKDAWHVVFKVRWFREKDGALGYEVTSRKEVFGLPNHRLGLVDLNTGKLERRDPGKNSREADRRYWEREKVKKGG